MSILKIARMGHPVLRQVAKLVEDPTDPEIHRLVADMVDTMFDAPGVGLAAPQVHVPLRVIVFHVPAARDGAEGSVGVTALINPEFEPLDDETNESFEGCLSLPGLTGKVSRFTKIRYRGRGLDGAMIEREVSGFHARVFQHEYDHLNGVLYPMQMDNLTTFGFVDEMKQGN
jgi:peptide deformylase